ncbi:MAG: glycine cleavage system protein GcvH [Acidobacteriota bacterium]
MYPEDYLYTEQHEWLHVDETTVTLGITSFAQAELGEVVFVDPPDVGDSFSAGDEIGSIESVKAVAEIYTPVAGEVIETNGALDDQPELVNDDPHHEGWIAKLRLASNEGLDGLMNAEAYAAFCDGKGA